MARKCAFQNHCRIQKDCSAMFQTSKVVEFLVICFFNLAVRRRSLREMALFRYYSIRGMQSCRYYFPQYLQTCRSVDWGNSAQEKNHLELSQAGLLAPIAWLAFKDGGAGGVGTVVSPLWGTTHSGAQFLLTLTHCGALWGKNPIQSIFLSPTLFFLSPAPLVCESLAWNDFESILLRWVFLHMYNIALLQIINSFPSLAASSTYNFGKQLE